MWPRRSAPTPTRSWPTSPRPAARSPGVRTRPGTACGRCWPARAGPSPAPTAPSATGWCSATARCTSSRTPTRPTDPTLVLRAAAAAASRDTRIDRASLDRLAERRRRDARPVARRLPSTRFVELLSAGPPAIGVIEALDQLGVWVRILPEWEPVRSRPQRNAYHRFTVDRHLCEAAANAAGLTDRVSRPDLLVLGALLHDIGKGRPGDHTEVGMDLVARMGPRMGLPPDDVDVLVAMVRHHLLLPDVATRRDLDDPATIDAVARAVGDRTTLELLDALTEADSRATGRRRGARGRPGWSPSSSTARWSPLGGAPRHPDRPPTFPTPEHRALLAAGEMVVRGRGLRPDPGRARPARPVQPGGRRAVAARPRRALGRRRVRRERHGPRALPGAAGARRADRVGSGRGRPRRALDGRLAIRARLAQRADTYAPSRPRAGHDGQGAHRQRRVVGRDRGRGPRARLDRRAVPDHPGAGRARHRHPHGQGPDPRGPGGRRLLRAHRRRREGHRRRPPGRDGAGHHPRRRCADELGRSLARYSLRLRDPAVTVELLRLADSAASDRQ